MRWESIKPNIIDWSAQTNTRLNEEFIQVGKRVFATTTGNLLLSVFKRVITIYFNSGNRTRPSRREEYKMNTETFGVPFSRGRGRGRGGYYRGGYNRGGYNNYQGGYNRSGGGYRGRNNYQRGGSGGGGGAGGGGGGTAWNNRRNRNQDWGRGDAPQRRDRGDDNRRREEGGITKGTTVSASR